MTSFMTLILFLFCAAATTWHVCRLEAENAALRSENGFLRDRVARQSFAPGFASRRIRLLLDSVVAGRYLSPESLAEELREIEIGIKVDFTAPTEQERLEMRRFCEKLGPKPEKPGESAPDDTPL